MADHIRFMTGYYPNRWLQFCWKFISPLLIVVCIRSRPYPNSLFCVFHLCIVLDKNDRIRAGAKAPGNPRPGRHGAKNGPIDSKRP